MTSKRCHFVLVEPLYAGNVGATCRALKNNGFSSLRLVRPPKLDGEATKMAWKSLDVLRGAKKFEALDEAIADCKLIVGFSARARRSDRPLLELDAALPRIVAAATARNGHVALLFGREDRGLTHAELASCQFLVRIDAAKERQVFNLSQAVLIAAYQLRRALLARGRRSKAPLPQSDAPLPSLQASARTHLRERIESALRHLGYEELADKRLLPRIVARADRLLDRAALEPSDLAMLLGVLRRIEHPRDPDDTRS